MLEITSWVRVLGPSRPPRLRNVGAELAPAGPADFDAAWRADMRRWAEVVAAAGAQPED